MINVNKETAVVGGVAFVVGVGVTAIGGFTKKRLKARKARKEAAENDSAK
jgi:hypothetical protein